MSAFGNVFRNLDWSVLTDAVIRIVPALLCIVLHELAHGLVAYRLGDPTAKNAGRLTLDPFRHIDWMGLAAMALFRFGWARPVPIDMRNFKDPKRGMALTALAGPAMNLLIAIVFLFLYGLLARVWYFNDGRAVSVVLEMVWTTAYLSLSLCIFNLLPIPPLDGSKIYFSVLSDEAYQKLMRYERYGMIVMLVLAATGAISGLLGTVVGWAYDKLFFIAEFAFELVG